ncbi:MAG: NrfD/PsrC family molybdoenzyme membrane anchor subunit [Candidatus Krumholzibacteriia bacterium]
MLEKALRGGRAYWTWLGILAAIILVGLVMYVRQAQTGLAITGLSRDVTWGFYIAQFTFLVGVAASAVMVVLPYYLHNHKVFGKMTVLGEFLAIAAVIMCMLFIMVDLGNPRRAMNIMLHPSPRSVMFWDMIVCLGYLFLNVLISHVTLDSERKGIAPPTWIKPFIIISIPWAISIHTVTAFLYSGLAARPFWLTAIMTPRFLATAFAAGPALLLLICMLLRRKTRFDVGEEPIRKLAVVVTYAMIANLFFLALEVFTALYSDIPEHVAHFTYLFAGLGEAGQLAPFMWASVILGLASLVLLINPRFRNDLRILPWALGAVFVSIWIDKGMGLVVAGFVPGVLGHVVEYSPTLPELLITLGVYGIGLFILTVLFKIALTLRGHVAR